MRQSIAQFPRCQGGQTGLCPHGSRRNPHRLPVAKDGRKTNSKRGESAQTAKRSSLKPCRLIMWIISARYSPTAVPRYNTLSAPAVQRLRSAPAYEELLHERVALRQQGATLPSDMARKPPGHGCYPTAPSWAMWAVSRPTPWSRSLNSYALLNQAARAWASTLCRRLSQRTGGTSRERAPRDGGRRLPVCCPARATTLGRHERLEGAHAPVHAAGTPGRRDTGW